MLQIVRSVARAMLTVATDAKPQYVQWVKTALPGASHKSVIGGRKPVRGAHNPLSRPNPTCAKVRSDLSRIARKTWATTKRMWALQYHLDLYIAFNNGYEMG